MGAIVYVHRRVLSYLVVRPRSDEQGAALVEYALLLALVVLVCIVAVTFLGTTAADKLSKVGQSVANA